MNKFISNIGHQLHKHSPEILLGIGVVGTVAATVIACKSTLKLNDILEDSKDTLDKIKEHSDKEYTNKEGEVVLYSAEDAKKDTAIVYGKTALEIGKTYLPAVALEAASVTCILVAFNILSKRNVALAAAYATVSEGYSAYRERVKKRFGEDIEKEIRYNLIPKKIDEVIVDEETGKTKTVKKNVLVSDLGEHSDYAFYFDQTTSVNWEPNDIHNDFVITSTANWMNDQLQASVKGSMTLLEVLKELRVEDSVSDWLYQAAHQVGWKINYKNKDIDNKIILETFKTLRELPDGRIIPTIIVDPHVDGYILDRLSESKY